MSPEEFQSRLNSIVQSLNQGFSAKDDKGPKPAAQKLQINNQELDDFKNDALSVFIARKKAVDQGQAPDRNVAIAGLRLVRFFEVIKERNLNLDYNTAVDDFTSIQNIKSQEQVRSLELTLRSLINKSFCDQATLIQWLMTKFRQTDVEKWQVFADKGDILSGTDFSTTIDTFTDKPFMKNMARLSLTLPCASGCTSQKTRH